MKVALGSREMTVKTGTIKDVKEWRFLTRSFLHGFYVLSDRPPGARAGLLLLAER